MAHVLACPRTPVAKLLDLLASCNKTKWLDQQSQNQKIALCCRHPEDGDIEAWYSSEEVRDEGIPDIYKLICTCGRTHIKFCVGGSKGSGPNIPEEPRPFWEVH